MLSFTSYNLDIMVNVHTSDHPPNTGRFRFSPINRVVASQTSSAQQSDQASQAQISSSCTANHVAQTGEYIGWKEACVAADESDWYAGETL